MGNITVTVNGIDVTKEKQVITHRVKGKIKCGLVYVPKGWVGKTVRIVLMEGE